MSSLQEIIYAEEWLNLAISKNKLGDFIIGIPPYAKTRINQGGIQEPILEPNLECLYSYYEDNPSTNFDKVVENELYKVISERGNNDFIIYSLIYPNIVCDYLFSIINQRMYNLCISIIKL